MRYFLIFLLSFLTACHLSFQKESLPENRSLLKLIDKNDIVTDTVKFDKPEVTQADNNENYNYQTLPFKAIEKFPVIGDTANFISALKANCHLSYYSHHETINYYRQIKIFGSTANYYLIEYDFHDGASCEYPFKRQCVFNKKGKLLKVLSEIRLKEEKIFPKENPFLFGVSSTGHGNGWHEVYRIRKDTLEQVYDGMLNNRPETYDVEQDLSVNEPAEFHHKITDINHDGFNDIIFYGKVVLIQGRTKDGFWYDVLEEEGKPKISYSIHHPFKKIPVAMTFLYHPASGHFKEEQDYCKKYKYIFGE